MTLVETLGRSQPLTEPPTSDVSPQKEHINLHKCPLIFAHLDFIEHHPILSTNQTLQWTIFQLYLILPAINLHL